MADEAPTPDEGTDGGDAGKTFTQAQLDKIVEERLARERHKYADYDDLKQAAARLAELEDEKKSDEQKLLDRVEAAERRAEQAEQAVKTAERDALRARVAAKHGLSDAQAKRLEGETVEELEADAVEVFGVKTTTDEDADDGDDDTEDRGVFGRPREKLKPGASNNSDDEAVDGDALADKVWKRKNPL